MAWLMVGPTVTILFFLWGFAYGLLDTLNSHFQSSLNISASESSGLSAAYFGAYFLCPLTISGWILRRYGFRVTFMVGLAVLTVGCLLFWPSGVKESFGGFCGSMFVVGVSTCAFCVCQMSKSACESDGLTARLRWVSPPSRRQQTREFLGHGTSNWPQFLTTPQFPVYLRAAEIFRNQTQPCTSEHLLRSSHDSV